MSEFSESYHLRTGRIEDAIELLRFAKLKGYVYPPANGWVTFLADEATFEPDQRIAAAQPLLHYVCAEDHGWSFTLFDRTRVVCHYRCDWDNDIQYDDTQYSRAALLQHVPSASPALLTAWEGRMHPKDFDELFAEEPAKLLAVALGLEHYDWLSYDGIDGAFHATPQEFPGVIKVT